MRLTVRDDFGNNVFETAFYAASDGIVITDADFSGDGPHILYANPAFTDITGYKLEEVIGQNPRFLQGPKTDRKVMEQLKIDLFNGKQFNGQTWNYRKNGEAFLMQWRIAPVADQQHNTRYYVAIQRDVTERETLIRKLELQSTRDELTDTYNRRYADQLLNKESKLALRQNHALSVILCDIDHFKKVNDTFGHQAGDSVLKEFSTIIKNRVRSTDAVIRWGGEEFLIVLPHTSKAEAHQVAENLRKLVADYSFQSVESITCSFGVATLADAKDPEYLIKVADDKLYQAKDKGRNCVQS